MGVALSPAEAAAGRFALEGPVHEVRAHAGGHIHDSYVVTGGARRYLLQRMNTGVFAQPELVMQNIAAATAHLIRKGERTLAFVPALDGALLSYDADGACWRMSEFIDGAITLERARDVADAERAAEAFGHFQRALADYGGTPLHLTLPGFHDTGARAAALDRAVAADTHARADRARDVLAGLARHRGRLAGFYGAALAEHPRFMRIAHHDAKIANVLFDAQTGAAICVVDLDTIMPGLSLYDFGDLVRSMASAAAEDEPEAARVAADPERVAAILRGYVRGTGDLLDDAERALLPGAGEAMTFEQSVRFLTDFLEGDRYYRVARPEQNLDRARAQLAVLDSLAEQHAAFQRMVR